MERAIALLSLFDPDEVQGECLGCFALPDICGDEGNGQARSGLECKRRGDMQRVERSQSRFLDQFFGLTQNDRAHFHQFPVTTIFVKP